MMRGSFCIKLDRMFQSTGNDSRRCVTSHWHPLRRAPVLGLALTVILGCARAVEPARDSEQGPHLLVAFGGAIQVLDDDPEPLYGLEYRPPWRWHGLGPWLSVGGGEAAGFYSAMGLCYDFRLGVHGRLTPSFGLGYFRDGEFELGHNLEFRSGIECTRRFRGGLRIGVAFAHISNGSIGDINPGTESVCAVLALPLGRPRN